MAIEYKKHPNKRRSIPNAETLKALKESRAAQAAGTLETISLDELFEANDSIIQFRLPKKLREVFAATCKRNGASSSGLLRQFMCDYVEGK